MGLQEGLLLLGGVVFLLILLDALRRKRAAAQHQQEQDEEDPDAQAKREELARELPGLKDPEIRQARKTADPLFDEVDVFDDDPIPVLRNSVQLDSDDVAAKKGSAAAMQEASGRITTEELRRLFSYDPAFAEEAQRAAAAWDAEEDEAEFDAQQADAAQDAWPDEAAWPTEVGQSEYQEEVERFEEAPPSESNAMAWLVHLEQSTWQNAEEFLTININARKDKPFEGYKLAYLMDTIGMQLSPSGFFHYVDDKEGAPVLGYTLVNMFSPGTFDRQTINDFYSLGVVLVMALPNTSRPQAIFERMLETARVFERNWDAELQDEQRSNLTLQTVEHYRQRIQDFEYQMRLKQLKARKAN